MMDQNKIFVLMYFTTGNTGIHGSLQICYNIPPHKKIYVIIYTLPQAKHL